MITEKFVALPPYIFFEGVSFELRLIINVHPIDVQLIYAIAFVDHKSRHYRQWIEWESWLNPFYGGAQLDCLYMVENIETDDDLIRAIEHCAEFLIENKLLTGAKKKEMTCKKK